VGAVVSQYRARTVKFDVDPDWVVPELAGVLPAGGAIAQGTASLVCNYFDTAGRHLLRHGVTLRLDAGDTDARWRLNVPEGAARVVLRAPGEGQDAVVPASLRRVVFGISAGSALQPVASIATERTSWRVTDAAGEPLVEVDDDRVTATGSGAQALAARLARGRGRDRRRAAALGDRLAADRGRGQAGGGPVEADAFVRCAAAGSR
jgi:hypothetical protein